MMTLVGPGPAGLVPGGFACPLLSLGPLWALPWAGDFDRLAGCFLGGGGGARPSARTVGVALPVEQSTPHEASGQLT